MALKKPKKVFIFTPQHEEIIQAVSTNHMLIAPQITNLLRPGKLGNLTTIQTRLAELTREKYLFAHHLATAKGQRPYVYTLSLHGKNYMQE